jgi:hypothetical protein
MWLFYKVKLILQHENYIIKKSSAYLYIFATCNSCNSLKKIAHLNYNNANLRKKNKRMQRMYTYRSMLCRVL